MPMELRPELCTIVGLQHKDTDREPLSNHIQEAHGLALIAGIVDLQQNAD